jgi:2-amino-4-hydroxy-6-hydroxymethyldihydropteridine diphosphokinase
MIVIALGSNQPGPWGNPEQQVRRALLELDRNGIRALRASRLLVSKPFGGIPQPPFVNGVAIVETHLPPEALMRRLHAIEHAAGRKRIVRWGPRSLDLDLIDYHGLVRDPPNRPRLPHPGIAERIFVLKPIAEIAPRWRHPVTHLSAAAMLRRLDPQGAGAEV